MKTYKPYDKLKDCECCGAVIGKCSNWPWHYKDEDCRAIREPRRMLHAHTLEELRPIPGFPQYHAGDDGSIYSFTGWRGQVLRRIVPVQDGDGYLKVRLLLNGKRVNRKVHRLVLLAFQGLPLSARMETCHVDGSKLNNAASNLRWGTRKDNADDRERHGRTSRGATHSQAIKEGLCRSK